MHFNYLEMKYIVFCVTLNLLFFASIVSSTGSIVPTAPTVKYEIKEALQMSCNVIAEDSDPNSKIEVKWEKNGTLVTDIEKIKNRLSLSHNANTYRLQLNSGHEEDAGNYSCVLFVNNIEQSRATISVESKVYIRIPRDNSVVEGEKLRVLCQIVGKPVPQIIWEYKNEQYPASKNRVKLEEDPEKKIPNAVFTLSDVTIEDQGNLTCIGQSPSGVNVSAPSTGVIRVKDKYAAVWPFLGICAEVIILCAIILIYEKKRNKTELEESDTDQSPEQKNTPDHGKETNLRHRQ